MNKRKQKGERETRGREKRGHVLSSIWQCVMIAITSFGVDVKKFLRTTANTNCKKNDVNEALLQREKNYLVRVVARTLVLSSVAWQRAFPGCSGKLIKMTNYSLLVLVFSRFDIFAVVMSAVLIVLLPSALL